jgi:hypothetical protein
MAFSYCTSLDTMYAWIKFGFGNMPISATFSLYAIGTNYNSPIQLLSSSKDLYDLGKDIRVYPNPVSYHLNIDVSEYENGLSYELYDITGRLCARDPLTSKHNTISIVHMPHGNCLIRVLQNGRVIYSKILHK